MDLSCKVIIEEIVYKNMKLEVSMNGFFQFQGKVVYHNICAHIYVSLGLCNWCTIAK